MGALLVVVHKVGGNAGFILAWLGINVVITVVGRDTISWQGHFGGLLGGLVVAALVVHAPRKARSAVQMGGFAAVAVILLALVVWRTLALA
jgi:membrane associated rhomboid family serine protease